MYYNYSIHSESKYLANLAFWYLLLYTVVSRPYVILRHYEIQLSQLKLQLFIKH